MTYVVLFLVIADMAAIKPTGDDVAVLIAMAAVFALGLGHAISRAQAVATPGEATA